MNAPKNDLNDDDFWKGKEKLRVGEARVFEAEPYPDLVAKYSLFGEKLSPKADVVYHPCGANDVSPSAAFPHSRVIYVEISKKSVEALKRGGFEAHEVSALEFDPGAVDILVLLNPQISPKTPSSHVVRGGYVLCNDYHGTATELNRGGEFEFRAIIRKSKNKELIFDTANLEDCWKEVETEEEFRSAPFSFGKLNYEDAATMVEAVAGTSKNILAEYKKIIRMAKEQVGRALANFPDNEKPNKQSQEMPFLDFEKDGQQFVLETAMPKKKGSVDDLFVFQKK